MQDHLAGIGVGLADLGILGGLQLFLRVLEPQLGPRVATRLPNWYCRSNAACLTSGSFCCSQTAIISATRGGGRGDGPQPGRTHAQTPASPSEEPPRRHLSPGSKNPQLPFPLIQSTCSHSNRVGILLESAFCVRIARI